MKPVIRHSALVGTLGCANFRGQDFEMHCICCGEESHWRTDRLVRRDGHDATVAAFSRHFPCPGCGEIGSSVLKIVARPADQQATRFRRMAPRPALGAELPPPPVHWRMRMVGEGTAVS